jgi:hypothetical protein
MTADEEQALDEISRRGYHVVWVPGDFTRPSFGYSIGIQKTLRRPDLVVTGHELARIREITARYVERIRRGETLAADGRYAGLLDGSDAVLKLVDPINNEELFGWAVWLSAGESFRMLQVIYPAPSGAWPWDDDAPREYLWEMMNLYSGGKH